MKEIKEIECLVRGRVQGVMYRDFARRQARQRSISGTVQNLSDGSVKVIAQGDEPSLQEFIARLRRGPFLSHIGSIEVLWRAATDQLDGFRIIS